MEPPGPPAGLFLVSDSRSRLSTTRVWAADPSTSLRAGSRLRFNESPRPHHEVIGNHDVILSSARLVFFAAAGRGRAGRRISAFQAQVLFPSVTICHKGDTTQGSSGSIELRSGGHGMSPKLKDLLQAHMAIIALLESSFLSRSTRMQLEALQDKIEHDIARIRAQEDEQKAVAD
jgi:hypothetical protein